MIEVLKQMVEALEVDGYVYNGEKSWAAIQAGKQAIAELESQEHVKTDDFSWIEDLADYEPLGTVVGHISNSNYIVVLVNEGVVVDLEDDVFPEPQKQRTWVGLTDDEIDECDWGQSERDHARAIYAKLKEKNT